MPVALQPRVKARWSPVGRTQKLQDYYEVRPASHDYDTYWANAVDPDGQPRERISERERLNYLGNVAEELAFVKALPPGNILDIGCGPGWFLSELSHKWRKLGLEISEQAIAEMTRLGIVNACGFEYIMDSWADVVVCLHVIEHVVDPIDFIGDIHRVLKKGGWLVIATPDFESPCAKRFGSNYRMLHDKTHCSLFTLESMHRFLRDHGFFIKTVHFPFPEKYATAENFARWNDTSSVSPPWPGNWMTFYCSRS